MANLDLFRHAEDADHYSAGQVVFERGAPGDVMYAVLEGEIHICIGEKVLDTVAPGGIFGQMALVDSSPRSASAMATAETKLVPITKKRFMFMVQQNPYLALEVMSLMAERLRRLMALQAEA